MLRHTCKGLLSLVIFFALANFSIAGLTHETAGVNYSKNSSEFWMKAGVEAWGGDITYRIGYPVVDAYGYKYYGYFPFSELEFPLDAGFGVVKAGAVFGNRIVLNAQVKANVSDPDDEMIDRDWTTENRPWRLDIYSESEVTDFEGLVLDGDIRVRALDWGSIWLEFGVGYMYQNFRYETAVIHQWSPSGLSGYNYWGDGRTSLIYEVDAMMPYMVVSGSFVVVDNLKIDTRLALAPWVKVEDEDQHLLRDKVNVGDMEGTAAMLTVDAQYDITPFFFVNGGFSHTYIEVDGEMDASFGGVYDHTVEEELESNQSSVFVTAGFRFGVPAN